jgi:hypothetical protein
LRRSLTRVEEIGSTPFNSFTQVAACSICWLARNSYRLT